jgi:hypothetical protein
MRDEAMKRSVTTDVLYDGGCGVCTRSVAWLRAVDRDGRLRFVDIIANWEHLEARYPGLRRADCLDAMHVVDPEGRITSGYDGVRTLAWRLSWLRILAPLLHLPGVPWLGRRVYRYVAMHRATTCPTTPDARSARGCVGQARD